MSYDPESLPVGGSDGVDYWSLGWDDPSSTTQSDSDRVQRAHEEFVEHLHRRDLPDGPPSLEDEMLGLGNISEQEFDCLAITGKAFIDGRIAQQEIPPEETT